MASVNKVIIVGNLGHDPAVVFLASGNPKCSFSVATSDSWTDKAGAKQERTEWHKIIVWGKQAEPCGKYLAKGRSVYVEGKIVTRSYEKDGEKKYITEIIADRVQFLGGRDDGGGAGERIRETAQQEERPARQASFGNEPVDDDSVPF